LLRSGQIWKCPNFSELPGGARPHPPRLPKPFDQTALASVLDEAMREQAAARSVVTCTRSGREATR
jgi:hypothetical protein